MNNNNLDKELSIPYRIPRYNKNQLIFIDNKEISLIDHIKELRQKNKITKKKISNLVKHNDYWYSQVERNGKKGDDNRQKTIYRDDLINVISIVKFNANSYNDLEKYKIDSEHYLDEIMTPVPLENSFRPLELYELFKGQRTPEEQDKLYAKLINCIENTLKQSYLSLNQLQRDVYLDALKNLNLSLKIDPAFIIGIIGLPYADFLYSAKKEEILDFFHDITNLIENIDQFINYDNKNDSETVYKYIEPIIKKIIEYTNNNSYDDDKNKKIVELTRHEAIEYYDKIHQHND